MELTMKSKLNVFIVVSVLSFSFSVHAETKLKCRSYSGDTAYLINASMGYDHDRYGTGPIDKRFQFAGFIASFDSGDDDNKDGKKDFRAVPEWVAYEMKRYSPDGSSYPMPRPSPARPSPWYEMQALKFLAKQAGVSSARIDKSYAGYGTKVGPVALEKRPINRGHLAMKSHIQRVSWKAACNTHVFVNAVPQQADMNQGDWLALEAYSGAAANQFERIWILAGPVWKNGKPLGWMKNKGTIPVAVPAGLFKIIIKENTGKLPDVLAFIFEQPKAGYVKCQQARKLNHKYNLSQYLTSINDIEKRTGLEFLRNVNFKNTAQRKVFKNTKAKVLWPVDDNRYTVTCG